MRANASLREFLGMVVKVQGDLDSAEDIADKNRIAADLRRLNNQAFQRELKQMTIDAKDPQSALEKNVKYLAKKYNVDEKTEENNDQDSALGAMGLKPKIVH